MYSSTNIKVIGDQVDHTQPIQSDVTFLNTIDETNFKALRARKRHTKLNHPNRRRKIQKMFPDQHDGYGGYNDESLSAYDLPKSYLQDHWRYYGFTWLYGECGPRKRKWGTKRFTKNFFCSNVFECGCKHTEKHIRMRYIKEEEGELDYL